MGLFLRIANGQYRSDYGHLDPAPTLQAVPARAFLPGFNASAVESAFTTLRGYLDWTAVAAWDVRRGERIGFSGDTGYSEAPHLHYAIARASGEPLCPTMEPDVANGGWLFLRADP